MPPDVHRRNASERAICTSKAHFIAILVGVYGALSSYLWDALLPQTKLILNLLHQDTLALDMSVWEYYNGPVNYYTTPFGPIGCKVTTHNKPRTRKSWDFRARDGFNICSTINHYQFHKVVDSTTKDVRVSDTIEFYHSYLINQRSLQKTALSMH